MNEITRDLHETSIDAISRLFNKKGEILIVKIRKDNLVIENEYSSNDYLLFKFHKTTFGIKEKEIMPPEVKFTIEVDMYDIELNMIEGKESSVIFREKANKDNLISLKVV